jgi:hypothetical protein
MTRESPPEEDLATRGPGQDAIEMPIWRGRVVSGGVVRSRYSGAFAYGTSRTRHRLSDRALPVGAIRTSRDVSTAWAFGFEYTITSCHLGRPPLPPKIPDDDERAASFLTARFRGHCRS